MSTPTSRAALLALAALSSADEWPQWRGPGRDGVWKEDGLLEAFPEKGLGARWRAPIGPGYSGPTVAGGRVYLMDRRREPEDGERVLCLDRETGKVLWTHAYPCSYAGIGYDAGPRCAVLVQHGMAFSLGASGMLFCLDAETGEELWSHDIDAEYGIDMPVWGIAAAPVIEGDLLIVPASAEDAYLIAFDVATGAERWKAFDDGGNYSAPIVIDQAGERVLVCWSAGRVLGVDPATGKLHWEVPFEPKNVPLGIATPVLYEDKLFFTAFYDGSLMLRVDHEEPKVEELWRRVGQNEVRTDALQSIIATPLIRGGHIYGVDSHGELRCLEVESGERVWEDLSAVPKARWANVHMVQNGERTWMFNEKGELILGELSPKGFRELARTKILEPTREQLNERGGVCWSHPAYAYRHVFVRNDEEVVCYDLSAK